VHLLPWKKQRSLAPAAGEAAPPCPYLAENAAQHHSLIYDFYFPLPCQLGAHAG